mgnify:CR=1 FL=1
MIYFTYNKYLPVFLRRVVVLEDMMRNFFPSAKSLTFSGCIRLTTGGYIAARKLYWQL